MFQVLRAFVEGALARLSIPSPWGRGLLETISIVSGGLALLFFILSLTGRGRNATSKLDRPARVLLKKAHRAERRGDFKAAAELFMAARSFQEAARAYVQIADYQKAAEACLANNDFANAARCFVRLGDPGRAAEYFLKAKDFLQAAENLIAVERFFEAAPMYVRGGQPVKAAECYARAGFFEKAGELLAAAGDHGRAAPFLTRALQERLGRRDSSVPPEDHAAAANLAEAAAQSLLASGEKAAAAQALESAGRFSRAAALYEEMGEKARASELFLRAKDTSSAVRVLKSSDRPQEGGLTVAEALLQEGKGLEAAELFANLGDHKRAARLFLDGGLKDRAAEAYRASGDLEAASELLLEIGRHREAAELLLAAGRAEEAAQVYRQMGERDQEIRALLSAGAFTQAARPLLSLGRTAEAVEALQQVRPTDGEFAEANRILGDVFSDQRQWSLAIPCYQRSLADETVRRETIDSFYRYATALREEGQLQGALSTMEKILLADYGYRDVRDQIQAIKGVIASASAAGGPPLAGPDSTIQAAQPQARRSGRYQIVEEIGRGGMGVVYRARDTLLDRVIAYKVLPPNVQKGPQTREMFLREAKAAARLSHPNIVTIYDADAAGDEYFIIMELVEGHSLKELLERQGRFPRKSALALIGQVMKALSYAHGRGIVHRDIKPANLLWSKQEKLVKVTDFGLARVLEEGRRTHTQMAGTPFYMAPEQILGGAVDHRADIYAVGVTLYEFLTATVPFREGDVLYHHVHTPPPPPESRDPSVEPGLSRIIMRCLEKDPSKRYPDVDSAFDALRGLVMANH